MKRKKVILLLAALLLFVIATPVVFFYLTTRMSSPKAFELTVDGQQGSTFVQKDLEDLEFPDSSITIVLVNKNQYICFRTKINATILDLSELRNYLKKEEIIKGELGVLIKPRKETSYKEVVDILDEMQINKVKKYQVSETSEQEEDFLKNLK